MSGFGFGGTNAHVVVRESTAAAAAVAAEVTEPAVSTEESVSEAVEPTVVLAVSGALPSRRRRAAADLADWLETEEGSTTPLADVARSLARRNHGRSRAVVLAKTRSEAVTGLRAIAAGKPGQGVFSADSPSS